MAPRLDTPLARALLNAGKVDPSALEAAIEEQLLHGGSLDTLLLELGLVDEGTVARLLSEAWETAPVDPTDIERPDPDAVRLLPERMAVAMRLCPIRLDATGLHVIVPGPFDKALVAEVGAMIGRVIVSHVVPELRVWQGLARAYGVAPEERFVSLMASVGGSGQRKVTPRIEEAPAAGRDLEPAPWDLVEAFAHLAAQDTRDGVLQVAVRFARKALPFVALLGVRSREGETTCHGWIRSGPADGVQFLNTPFVLPARCALATCLSSPAPFLGRPDGDDENAALFGWLGRRRPRTFVAVPIVVGGRAVGALVGDGGVRAREVHSLTDLVSFGARLGPAFEALLRQRQRQHPSLFPTNVAPVPAPGPPPSGDPPPRATPRPITISMPAVDLAPPSPEGRGGLDGTSPFARAYAAPSAPPTLAPRPPQPQGGAGQRPFVATGSSLDDVLPRIVDVPGDLQGPDDARAGLSMQAPAALQTFSRLDDSSAPEAWRGALHTAVARGHQGGTATPGERPRVFLDEDDWEDIVLDAAHAAALGARKPAAVIALPSLVEQMAEAAPDAQPETPSVAVRLEMAPPTQEAAPPRALDVLVDDLAALDDATVAAATDALLRVGAAAVPALSQRFPGRLRCDPFDPGATSPGATELGPLVSLLAALGPQGLEAAIPHLDSRYPAHRYCAVLLFAHTPDARAIDLVRARLHDQEPRIQRLAADALAPFVSHPHFASVLAHLRERLAAPLVEARRRAAQLLGAFRDVGAVPSLIALLDRGPELAADAHQALRLITLQDHGVRARGWEKWWTRAKKKSRVDWLLEGLASEDRELRTVAAVELAAMAGDDFGFHADADRAARKKAEAAFSAWWLELRQRRSA